MSLKQFDVVDFLDSVSVWFRASQYAVADTIAALARCAHDDDHRTAYLLAARRVEERGVILAHLTSGFDRGPFLVIVCLLCGAQERTASCAARSGAADRASSTR